jgi:hypothetical protein
VGEFIGITMPNFDFDCLNPHQLLMVRALAKGEAIRFDGEGGDPTHDDGNLYISGGDSHTACIQVSQVDLEVLAEAGFRVERYQHNINECWKAIFRPVARDKILTALSDFDGDVPAPKSHEEALRIIIAAIDDGESNEYVRNTAVRALELPTPEPAKVVVTVEGGVVQCIDANTASLKAIVIDHDNEGSDRALVAVPHLAKDDPDAKDGENDAAIFEFTHEVMPESFFTDLQRAAAEYHEANDLAAHESSVARP